MRETPQERNQRALGRMVPGTIGGTLKSASPAQLPQSAAKPRIAQEPPSGGGGLCNSFAYEPVGHLQFTGSPVGAVSVPLVPLTFVRFEFGTASLPFADGYVYPGAVGLWMVEATLRCVTDGDAYIEGVLIHSSVEGDGNILERYSLGWTHNNLDNENYSQTTLQLSRTVPIVMRRTDDFLYMQLYTVCGGTYFDIVGEDLAGYVYTQMSGIHHCPMPDDFNQYFPPT